MVENVNGFSRATAMQIGVQIRPIDEVRPVESISSMDPLSMHQAGVRKQSPCPLAKASYMLLFLACVMASTADGQ